MLKLKIIDFAFKSSFRNDTCMWTAIHLLLIAAVFVLRSSFTQEKIVMG